MGFLKKCVTIVIAVGSVFSLSYTNLYAQNENAGNAGGLLVTPTGGQLGGGGANADNTGGTTPADTSSPTQLSPPGTPTCSDTISCLMAITQNTYGALQAVNTLPTYLYNAGQYFLNWTASDKSEDTKTLQEEFGTLGNQVLDNARYVLQKKNLKQLTADLLGFKVSDFEADNRGDVPIKKSLPDLNVNDLAFPTVLGKPPVEKGEPASAYEYIKNAAGLAMAHLPPSSDWPIKDYLKRYTGYYKTVQAANSYSLYVLDYLVAENANKNTTQQTQLALIKKASSSEWLGEVATEKLGLVLRQMLMFESQSYLVLTQMLETQRQMLAAQVMTNSLIIASSLQNEAVMTAKAQNLQLT